ncbi:NUDIX domain-containing protein [Candidatus Woesearchaeota archaeon]|nr:NUDIX domain-containing protein [Candidatus Woesearchaeota archaeon]
MAKEKSVGGIIFIEEPFLEKSLGKKLLKRYYLLLEYERINDKEGKHKYWDFPKGHVEEKENEIGTLRREVLEETGIKDLEILNGFKEIIKYFFRKEGTLINKEVIYFLARTNTKEVNVSSEHTGFKWLRYEEALKKINFKNSKDILKKAEKFLKNSLLDYQ